LRAGASDFFSVTLDACEPAETTPGTPAAPASDGRSSAADLRIRGFVGEAHMEPDADASVAAFRAFALGAPVGLLHVDVDWQCRFANDAWYRLVGSREHGVGPTDWLAGIHPDDRERVERAWTRARTLVRQAAFEFRVVDARTGGSHWISGDLTPLRDGDGLIDGWIATASDVTDQKLAQERLHERTRRDGLTDLPNRVQLRETLHAAHEQARTSGHGMALLFLDLDEFKEINDTLGHEAGDRLLVQVARRVRATVRGTDLVARLGGDEFAIVLPLTDHADGARVVALAVMRAIEAPFTIAGHQVTIGASLGIALYPDHAAENPDVLMRQADHAMYQAKRERLGVAFFDPTLAGPVRSTGFARLGQLRRAIEDGQLVLHYQPWLDLHTGMVNEVEALVRWQHPTRGLLSPAEFLPLAEQSGLIRALDVAVLDLACAQVRAWRDGPFPGLHVAVNISRASLLDDDFPATVAAKLIRHRLEGPELELEVTEMGVFGDPDQAAWLAERLQALSVSIAIDDFGTGYSSLAQLRKLRPTTLKIDRSFVTHALSTPDDAAIVESVAALGHRFGQRVVAEGVEDAATLELVASLGADCVQGYHVCRPLAADAVEVWMRTHGANSLSVVDGGRPAKRLSQAMRATGTDA
jgi:diguanylate cyclase (GGDEF)-like protein/PAS domain S-box-containing protein